MVDYQKLRQYISKEMKMQHIYQPVMIKTLLESKGHCATVEAIARQFLVNDEPQLQYYKVVTKAMPGRVLRSHDIVRYEGVDDQFVLAIKEPLSQVQVRELIRRCDEKIREYEEKYGGRKSVWHSRFAGAKDISGPLQYEVLKRAKERCELCGISSRVKALQVDHIVPRSKGGLTVLENLQALCYSCNAQKQNRDDTDFRGWPKLYDMRDEDCVFCRQEEKAEF